MTDTIRRDRSLVLLADAVADFEREFGEITPQEIAAQQRADRQDATVVRGRPKRSAAPPRQPRLSQALAGMDIRAIDERLGRSTGQLLAAAGLSDVIDASGRAAGSRR